MPLKMELAEKTLEKLVAPVNYRDVGMTLSDFKHYQEKCKSVDIQCQIEYHNIIYNKTNETNNSNADDTFANKDPRKIYVDHLKVLQNTMKILIKDNCQGFQIEEAQYQKVQLTDDSLTHLRNAKNSLNAMISSGKVVFELRKSMTIRELVFFFKKVMQRGLEHFGIEKKIGSSISEMWYFEKSQQIDNLFHLALYNALPIAEREVHQNGIGETSNAVATSLKTAEEARIATPPGYYMDFFETTVYDEAGNEGTSESLDKKKKSKPSKIIDAEKSVEEENEKLRAQKRLLEDECLSQKAKIADLEQKITNLNTVERVSINTIERQQKKIRELNDQIAKLKMEKVVKRSELENCGKEVWVGYELELDAKDKEIQKLASLWSEADYQNDKMKRSYLTLESVSEENNKEMDSLKITYLEAKNLLNDQRELCQKLQKEIRLLNSSISTQSLVLQAECDYFQTAIHRNSDYVQNCFEDAKREITSVVGNWLAESALDENSGKKSQPKLERQSRDSASSLSSRPEPDSHGTDPYGLFRDTASCFYNNY